MTEIIGIDLGTTNSLAAYMGEDGPRAIPNALGQVLTPSVVGIGNDGRIVVGAAARELQVLHPERCVGLFKRKMGSDWKVELGDREFSPEELSSLVLRSLKEDAEAFFGHPIGRAVITVPAYFNDQQRKATLNAGRIAGFQVDRILNEPTAAALAYGFHEAGEEKVLLIFDLGGGTFDVSLVELFEGTLEVRASSGESFLGGEDFTRTLAARVLEKQGYVFERAELDAPHLVARMIQQCELAKCALSSRDEASVRVADKSGDLNEQSPRVAFSREEFEKWTGHIMARVELPIRRVLGDASLRREDVHEVILVGGATRMPAVVELVTRTFAKEPRNRLNPDEVVALGAAVQAGLIARHQSVEDMVVTDVSPFTLGVEVSKQFGHEHRDGYFLPIIDRNTTIPVSRIHRLSTISANQTGVKIRIYQGENRRIEGNLFIGEFAVEGIPRGPAGQAIDLRFTYDLNGVLEVEATIVETAKTVRHVVTRYARGLNSAQIERAVEEMKNLKTQPREEAANRFLIQRAERVYRELTLEQRERLGQLLDGFEEVLGLNDASAIERHREVLTRFLDLCESSDPNQFPFDDDDLS